MCRYPTLRAVATLPAQFQLQLDQQHQQVAFCGDLRLLDLTGGSLPRSKADLRNLEPVVTVPKYQR
jgi:hypothetical protein